MQLKFFTMEIRFEHDVVLARQRARSVAAFLKFDVQDQTRIATAVSESARNCFEYAGGGLVEFTYHSGAEWALANSGYSLLEASGGKEGIRMAKEMVPSVIMLDISMPDLGGFEVLAILKKAPETTQIPVIIHTSQDLREERREQLKTAADIVPKEAGSREIAEVRIAEALSRAGLPFGVHVEDEVRV
jgi:CheY-like chemotaxis protein